ncbi:hypothetical protein C8R48DRAFT_775116 [Suillus tomentosus]|nr:hypothetical protein C8R48DRAFT_775116 [Suillus tomentosus]
MTSRQNQPSIEELTAQRAKALEEDRKDALRELEHYQREPVTFNAGERVTDLVRFWEKVDLVERYDKFLGVVLGKYMWRFQHPNFGVLIFESVHARRELGWLAYADAKCIGIMQVNISCVRFGGHHA